MIPIDNYVEVIRTIEVDAKLFLNDHELEEYKNYLDFEKRELLKNLLERPIDRFTPINHLYFRKKWAHLLTTLFGQQKHLEVLEVASGAEDMIPQAMERVESDGKYRTINMNKKLNQGLLCRTKDLKVDVEIIADDAKNITSYLNVNSIDIIAFQHSVNDILQAILCNAEGIDTIDSDWMKTLPKMIKILQDEVKNTTFEKHTKGPFIDMMRNLINVLKKDGIIAINHYLFQLDLDWGYPSELFNNIVPMTREWMKELTYVEEFQVEGFESQWWLFLKKKV